MYVIWYNGVNDIEHLSSKKEESTYLGYTFRTGLDTSPRSRYATARFGLAKAPSTTYFQMGYSKCDLFLNMIQQYVAGWSYVACCTLLFQG
jgi:hypothetical protein